MYGCKCRCDFKEGTSSTLDVLSPGGSEGYIRLTVNGPGNQRDF
jgi:hypothetical protein